MSLQGLVQIIPAPSRWWRRPHSISITLWPSWLAQALCAQPQDLLLRRSNHLALRRLLQIQLSAKRLTMVRPLQTNQQQGITNANRKQHQERQAVSRFHQAAKTTAEAQGDTPLQKIISVLAAMVAPGSHDQADRRHGSVLVQQHDVKPAFLGYKPPNFTGQTAFLRRAASASMTK